MAHKARMPGEPGVHLFAGMHAQIVQHHMDGGIGGRIGRVDGLQQGDEFGLAFAARGHANDPSRPRIKRRQ